MFLGIHESQWRYYRHWLILLAAAETLMLTLNRHLYEVYLIIAALFLGGFLLRVLKLYPGEDEPLILDASAVLLALAYAFTAKAIGPSWVRFLIILCSSGVIIPHFIFISKEK